MSRDLDSRFSEREKAATEEWLRSNKGGFHLHLLVLTFVYCRGVINGKAGKAAALPRFLDMLTLSQPGGAGYAHQLTLPHLKVSVSMSLHFRFL